MTPAPSAARSLSHEEGPPPRELYVYDLVVRLWHWVSAAAILTLTATGYFIALPMNSLTGEASDHFFNGYVRVTHFVAAYVLAIGFLVRGYWLLVGGKNAREMFFVPLWRPSFLRGLFNQIRYYVLIKPKGPKHRAHNALARVMMFFVFVLGGLAMVCSGFGLYSEGTAGGSWQRALFGWTIPLAGSSMTLRTFHHATMYYLWTFILVHLYLVFREDLVGRSSMVTTMITGWRTFRDDDPIDED
jgi:Ni/Fe-hydrogenase 1 B-type cytochrome subunit